MKIILTYTLRIGEKEILKKENIIGIKQNKILEFDIEQMHHELNLESKRFIRENDEYKFELNIEAQKCILELKREKHILNIEVDYASLVIERNKCNLEYLIETSDEKVELEIIWEEKNDN